MNRPSYAYGLPTSPLDGRTIGQALHSATENAPDSPALVVRHQGYRATYRQLWDQTTQAARALLAHGTKRGDRVAVWAPNRFEWTVLQYATARIGAILVRVNPGYTPEGVEHALKLSGTVAPFHSRYSRARTSGHRRRHGGRDSRSHEVIELETQWNQFLQSADDVSHATLAEREAGFSSTTRSTSSSHRALRGGPRA